MKRIYLKITSFLIALLSLSSCFSYVEIDLDRPSGRPDNGYDINHVKFFQNHNWKITLEDRFSIQEDGREIYIDPFHIQSADRKSYYMDIISEQQLKEDYKGSLTERFKAQALSLIQDHKDGYIDLNDELMFGDQDIEYNRLSSGVWIAYCFGMLGNGELTGDYQVREFNLRAEKPDSDYLQWLGEWKIGDHRTQYRIQVKQDEPNYSFAITGWEGNDSDAQDYVILTDFDRKNGNMVFYNQILGDYQGSNKNWYDIMFCGSFYYKENGKPLDLLTVIGPGAIATAVYPKNDSRADIIGVHSSVKLDDKEHDFQFNFMQLKDIPEDENLPMLSYNEIVPEFPYHLQRINTLSEQYIREGRASKTLKASRYKEIQKTIRRRK